MSETDITIEGMEAYMDKLTKSPDRLIEHILQQAMQDAEMLAVKQRINCPAVTGMLRESIEAFCNREGDVIEAGTRTGNEHAALVELGTGPRGSEKGHPLDSELGVVRKSEPWRVNILGIGVRYTGGQPAAPFMYPAIKEMEKTIKLHFGSAVREVLR